MREPRGTPAAPRTDRGWRTRRALLRAAEEVFGRDGFHAASVTDITRTAGVGQGTFYLYFASKEAVFVELVRDMGHDMRRRMHDAAGSAPDRMSAEAAGFRAFLEHVAQHPNMYRIVRECEFVAPDEHRAWYERLAEAYVRGLKESMRRGEIKELDPELVAFSLMGIGHFVGMRLVLWDGRKRIPDRVVDTIMDLVRSGLTPPRS